MEFEGREINQQEGGKEQYTKNLQKSIKLGKM